MGNKLNYIILITCGVLVNTLNCSCKNDKYNLDIDKPTSSSKKEILHYQTGERQGTLNRGQQIKNYIDVLYNADSITNLDYCTNNADKIKESYNFLNENYDEVKNYWKSKKTALRTKLDAVKKFIIEKKSLEINRKLSAIMQRESYENEKDYLKAVFEDTYSMSRNLKVDGNKITHASILSHLNCSAILNSLKKEKTQYEFVFGDALEVALNLQSKGFHVAAHVAANGRKSKFGGGVTYGEPTGQEEDVMRRTTAYYALETEKNKSSNERFYIEYQSALKVKAAVLKNRKNKKYESQEIKYLDLVFCPAPQKAPPRYKSDNGIVQSNWDKNTPYDAYDVDCLKDVKSTSDEKYLEAWRNKLRSMLLVAKECDCFVVIADWGCGIFDNDSDELVTQVYNPVFEEFHRVFKKVVFVSTGMKSLRKVKEKFIDLNGAWRFDN